MKRENLVVVPFGNASDTPFQRRFDFVQYCVPILRAPDKVIVDFADYEGVKRIAVIERASSVEAEELTPTLKKRRDTITANFDDRIEQLYG